MPMYTVVEGILTGFSLLTVTAFMLVAMERLRWTSGKEMLTDKFITYLDDINRRTAPDNNKDGEVRGYSLSDKVQVKKFYFHEQCHDQEIDGG